jgi:hypothetical protein
MRVAAFYEEDRGVKRQGLQITRIKECRVFFKPFFLSSLLT